MGVPPNGWLIRENKPLMGVPLCQETSISYDIVLTGKLIASLRKSQKSTKGFEMFWAVDKLGTKLRSILVSLEVWKVSSQLLTCRPAMYDVKFKKEEIHGFSELQKSMDMIIYCLFIYSFIGLFLNIFLDIYIYRYRCRYRYR